MSFSNEEIKDEISDSMKLPAKARRAYGIWATDVTVGPDGERVGVNGPTNPEGRFDD
jgi:hypothetical protein